jgi:hypothetical protein
MGGPENVGTLNINEAGLERSSSRFADFLAPGARAGSAQSMNDMVRTLNNIVNPSDAQRLEDQARRTRRPREERYWHDYRAGLDSPDRNRRDYGPDYRGRGDYRSQRDEGYSGDSGYRRAYPIKEISVRSALRSALRTQPAVTLVRLVSSRQKH